MSTPTIDRFMAKVSMEPMTGCWLWLGFVNQHGYGKFSIGETRATTKMARAHRVSYQLFKGLIPKGLELDHLCRVRCCVNPNHLEAVTSKENTRRGLLVRGRPERPVRLVGRKKGIQRVRRIRPQKQPAQPRLLLPLTYPPRKIVVSARVEGQVWRRHAVAAGKMKLNNSMYLARFLEETKPLTK